MNYSTKTHSERKFEFQGWMGGVLIFLLIFIFLSITAPAFLNPVNLLRNWILPAGIASVVSLGMTIVMAGGGINLSVGASAGLSALFAASLSKVFGIDLVPMFIIALISGVLIGAINGMFVSYLGINPFVVTLSSVYLIRGLQYVLALSTVKGTYIMLSKPVLSLGANAYFQIGSFILASILIYIFLEKTRYGRYIKAIGTNIEVARFSGINVRYYTMLTYLICGLLTALGGFMLTAYEGVVRIGAGEGYLIDSFVFPILGQAVFRKMSVEGTLFGALLMYLILNGLYIFGTSPETTDFIKGGLVLLILIISGIQKIKG